MLFVHAIFIWNGFHNSILDLPHIEFTFNKGHVSFFYNKLQYIERRYFQLRGELLKRKYNINLKDEKVLNYRKVINPKYYGDWEPDKHDHTINIGRLQERLLQCLNWYRFYSNKIQETEYIQNLAKYLK